MGKIKLYGLILCAAFVAGSLRAAAQNVPDNEAILAKTIDSASPFYYPALQMRYMAGDSTLTAEDFHYLYYGFAFREEYKPLEPIPAQDMILQIFALDPEPDSLDCTKIVEYAHRVMRSDPFNPTNINFLIYAYGVLGDRENEVLNRERLDMILETIRSSGTGVSEKSPWHVLFFSHATDAVVSLGLQPMKRLVVSRTVEYIPLLQKRDNIKGYYFDFSRVYWNRPDAQPAKEYPGFQLNGIDLNRKKERYNMLP